MNWMDEARAKNPAPAKVRLPERYQDATGSGIPRDLEALRNTTYNYLKDFRSIAPKGIGCLFVGRARKYKTYAACTILRVVNAAVPLEVAFVQSAALFSRLERSRFTGETDETIRKLTEIPLLCMDDFFEVQSNSFGSGVLTEIVDLRWDYRRPTIWTANIAGTPKQVLEAITGRFTPNIARRIHDGTDGYRVYINE